MTSDSSVNHSALGRRSLASDVGRRGVAGIVALGLSIAACYGTLAAVAALSALGFAVAVNPGAWAGAIVLFALLATLLVGLGKRKHGSALPVLPALAGTALLAYVMFGRFDRVLEILAFALLAGAVYSDDRLRARARS